MNHETEIRRISQRGGAASDRPAGGRFFRFYWWRTPPAVGLVEDCS